LKKLIALTPILLALAVSYGTAIGQNQPPQSVNQQDEVVHVTAVAPEDLDDTLEILRSDDKFETNDYVTEVFELKNALAFEMRFVIEQAVRQEKGVVRAVATKPTDGSSPKQFLVVTTTRLQMPSIERAIGELDVNGYLARQGLGRRGIRIQYRKASEVGEALLATRLSALADVFADDQTNTLYFDDTPYVAESAMRYVKFLDVPVPQVEFDLQIIEVREDDSAKLGLDWDAWKRTIGGQFAFSGNAFEGGDRFGRLDTLLTLDANVLANFLNYTVQSGNARLMQRSKISASNLRPALLTDSKRVPSIEYERSTQTASVLTEPNRLVDAAEKSDEPNNVTGQRVVTITPPVTNRLVDLGEDEEGISILIEPVIAVESVRTNIEIAMNTVTGYDLLGRPIVTQQSLSNQFTLNDEETLLLGSLERELAVEVESGIPFLKDIPVLKFLFATNRTEKQRSRIFIVATPKFDSVQYDAMTLQELDSKPSLRMGTREVPLTPLTEQTVED
jgi:type II secretory pathway component GspD/PulD (secretin)